MAPAYEGTFKTTDNLELFERRWQPRSASKAGVVLIHGYADHSGRYAQVAARLTDRGYSVSAFDQRGHGRSPGRRAFISSFEDTLEDLDEFISRISATFGGRPLFLMGQSMGALIIALYAATRKPAVHGLALCSPSLRVANAISPFLQRAAGVVAVMLPRLPVLLLDATAISRDPAAVQAYTTDPLVYHGRIQARTGAEIMRATNRARELAHEIDLPLLILHGTADRLCDVRGSQELFDGVRSPDKTLKLYDGAYHELFNEPEREAVIATICDWLDVRSR